MLNRGGAHCVPQQGHSWKIKSVPTPTRFHFASAKGCHRMTIHRPLRCSGTLFFRPGRSDRRPRDRDLQCSSSGVSSDLKTEQSRSGGLLRRLQSNSRRGLDLQLGDPALDYSVSI